MSISDILPDVQENVLLANYTTFKIGGPARYFFVAKNQEDIIKALKTAKEFNLPFFILGGGSHVLVNDSGFNGLVIKTQNSGYKIEEEKIIAEGGALLGRLVMDSINNNLTGLEWAIGIPGTIAGAVYGNAGAYGHSISESVRKIVVLSSENGAIKEYLHEDCGFVYRGSNFKENNNYIILQVHLELRKGDKEESRMEIKKLILQRKGKNPPYPSAGCIFKNIKVVETGIQEVEGKFITKIQMQIPKEKIRSGKFATGYLIDQCGLLGEKIGQAQIWEKHGNFIINLGGTKAEDVMALINLCKEKVKEKYGIELEEEIRYLGF